MNKKIVEKKYKVKKVKISFHYPRAGWTPNELKDYIYKVVKIAKKAVWDEPCHCHIRSYVSYYCVDSVGGSLGDYGGWREDGDAPEIILEISMLKNFSDDDIKILFNKVIEMLLEEESLRLSWIHVEEISSGIDTIKATGSHGYVASPNTYYK